MTEEKDVQTVEQDGEKHQTTFSFEGVDQEFVVEDLDEVSRYLYNQVSEKQAQLNEFIEYAKQIQSQIDSAQNTINFLPQELKTRCLKESSSDE